MTESHSVITPRRTLLRFIVDHNPCFILSAVCMLAGCLALTNSLSWSPIPLRRVVLLVVTLNIYELMLVGLALFLIVKRRLKRDGTILLILEAFFLVDVTFLNAELFALDLRIGIIANAIVFALALVKVLAIYRGLGISLRDGSFALILIELALLFAMPGMFKQIALHRGGTLPAGAIYGAWWMIGTIPVIAMILLRTRRDDLSRSIVAIHQNRHAIGLLMLLPVISLLAHASTSNWVYHVRWYPANMAPLILGLAVAIGGYDWHVGSLSARMRTQFVLPLAAVLVSANFPSSLVYHAHRIDLSPLRFALAGATLVYLHGLWMHRHMHFAWAACTCVFTGLFGSSPPDIHRNMVFVGNESVSVGRSLIPRTTRDWGIASIGAAFLLLLLGAALSMLKRPDEPGEHTVD